MNEEVVHYVQNSFSAYFWDVVYILSFCFLKSQLGKKDHKIEFNSYDEAKLECIRVCMSFEGVL